MKSLAFTTATILLAGCIAYGQEEPKVGAFLGYQYNRFNSATNVPAFSANGGDAELVFHANHWFGIVADLGGVNKGSIAGYNLDTTVANFLFGPRVTFASRKRVSPFIQVLFGGVYATTSAPISGIPLATPYLPNNTVLPGNAVTARLNGSQTAFAMTAGGGVDIRLSKHVSFRPLTVEYYMTRLQNLRSLEDNNQNNLRYMAGFTFWFGGAKQHVAHRAATKTCPNGATVPVDQPCPKVDFTLSVNASPAEVCQGDPVQVTATPQAGANGLKYAWTANGQPVGQQQTLTFDTTGKDPGTYRIAVHATGEPFNPASAETSITVKEYRPPTGTAQANPAQIKAGEKSTVSANFTGECGGPIQSPTFTASEGSMSGDQFDSSTLQWDTSNNAEQHKTITVTAKAADNRSTGEATTTIDVVRGAVAVPVRLPDVLFTDNSSRVNNCGKRILLEQLRSYFERDNSGTVVLVGHASSDEKAGIAESRAMNSTAVITAGTGICSAIPASQVQVSWPGVDQNGVSFESGFCQSSVGAASTASEMRRVEVWFVPSGGQLPASVTNNVSASTLSLSGLGCPK